jgi:hypothetical protein
MTRNWLLLSLALLLAFLLLISIAVVIGTLIPAKPVLADFQPCAETFCWLNINVQQDSMTDAVNILTGLDYTSQDPIVYLAPDDSPLCDVVFGGAVSVPVGISSLQLLNCSDLQLGDIWNIFGKPQFIALDCFDTWIMWYDSTIAVLVNGDLTPRSPVFQVIFFNQAAFDRPIQGIQWHGFTTRWRHDELEIRGC